ncbi:hypothetical protein CR513_02312, partial [Mucuna pruriens]
MGLFTSYTASYKGFKSRFVKIQATEAGMLKKQGVDMAELIKKARLTNDAKSTGQKVPDAATNVVAAEKESATGLAEKDLAPMVKKLTTLTMSNKEAGKRKTDSTRRRRRPLRRSKGKVVVTSGPYLPLGGLSCYVAPPTSRFDVRGLFPTNRISQHDRGLPVLAGADNSIDMMTAYMAHSMASLEVWRGVLRKAEQIVAKEAINKKSWKRLRKPEPSP